MNEFTKTITMTKLYLLTVLIVTSATGICAQKFSYNENACDPTTTKSAVKYYNQSLKTSKSEDARELLNKAIGADPNFYEAHFQLGIKYYKAKKYAMAKDHMEQVRDICPKYSPYTYYILGQVQLVDEDWKGALASFKQFMEFEDIDDNDKYNEIKDMLPDLEAYVDLITKPVPFDPKPVVGVCTKEDEYLGSLTPDNRYFYYIRKKFIKPSGMDEGKEPYYAELFTVSVNNNNSYDGGTVMDKPFNQKYNNGAAAITADNKHMYFVICENNQVEYCDLWFSDFTKGQWTTLKNMGSGINSNAWDSQPTISYDGKTLMFSSMRDGGQGNADIWMCTKNDNGTWSAPVNLGPVINTPEHELSPFLHSDSQTLYFSSKGHRGLGGYDIYYSRKDSAGNWSKPKNIGYPINTEFDEASFFVSLDGKTGFYSSDRLSGPGGIDIYSFPLYEKARPEEVLFIEGTVKTSDNKPVSGEVELKNMTTQEVTKVKVDSTDGKYVAVVTNKDDYLLSVKTEGYAFTSNLIKKDEVPAGQPTTKNVETNPIKVGEAYRLNDINFTTNSSELNDAAKFIIKEFSEFLVKNPKIKISIDGHTDDVGNDQANMTLSENRARSVYEYLISLGIGAERMTYKGYGETRPLASNKSEFGRSKNRRTEFVITAK